MLQCCHPAVRQPCQVLGLLGGLPQHALHPGEVCAKVHAPLSYMHLYVHVPMYTCIRMYVDVCRICIYVYVHCAYVLYTNIIYVCMFTYFTYSYFNEWSLPHSI